MNDDEKRLRAYFLKLAPVERDADISEDLPLYSRTGGSPYVGPFDEFDGIEDEYLSTSDHAELIEDVERQLVSDYAQGRLSPKERLAFELNYLVTVDRREEVGIARALAELAALKAVAPSASLRPNLWNRFIDWIGAPGRMVGLAAATSMILLLVTNGTFFLRWREQIKQTEEATRRIRELQSATVNIAPPVKIRVFGTPVLRIAEMSLSAGQRPRLTFRLPPEVPDTVEIPLVFPNLGGETAIDASISSSDHTVWSSRGLKLTGVSDVRNSTLQIPFDSLRPYVGHPLRLDLVERGHAVIAGFEILLIAPLGQPAAN